MKNEVGTQTNSIRKNYRTSRVRIQIENGISSTTGRYNNYRQQLLSSYKYRIINRKVLYAEHL